MKPIYIAEVKNAEGMTKSSKNALIHINGKYYAVGNKEVEDDNCTIWDNCGRGWWVDSDTIVELPIDEEIIGSCSICKHYDADIAFCPMIDLHCDDDFYCKSFDEIVVQ